MRSGSGAFLARPAHAGSLAARLVVVAAGLGLWLGAVASEEEPIAWTTDVRAAIGRAERDGIPVVVDVWAVWCAPCKVMDKTTYRDERVVGAFAGLVPLKVDADINETFLERHLIEAFPTVIFLDGDGDEIARREGLLPASELLPAIDAVRSGYREYLAVKSSRDAEGLAAAAAYLRRAGNPAAAAARLRRALARRKDGDGAGRETLELRLAEAQFEAGQLRPAQKALEELAGRASAPEVRAGALAALVRVQRARGRAGDAERSLAALRREFPELAVDLESPAGDNR